ncbi:MAG TPA: cupin domain-containing protein [Abditibacteriaceae bacterium]|jgi:mannose-6-phosphate isomerase-like protein (cupin superfamily)
MTLDPVAAPSTAQCKVVLPDLGECFEVFGDRIRNVLTSQDTNDRFAVIEAQTPAGSGPPLHVNSREDGLFIVQNGRYEFEIGSERIEAAPGAVVFIPREVPHTFWVAGNEPGRVLTCVWPGGYDRFFRCCSREFDTGAPDIHNVFRIGSEHGVTFLTAEGAEAHMAQRERGVGLQTRVVHASEGENAALEGSQVRFVLTAADTAGQCALLEMTAQPGCGAPLHTHSREDEVFIVQSGCYQFQLGDRNLEAGPQTVIYAACGVPHAFRVMSAEPGQMLVLTVPGAFEQYWRRCGEFGVAPDSGTAAEIGAEFGLSYPSAAR